MPYFTLIGQAVAEKWLFFIFQDGGRPPFRIFKRSKFYLSERFGGPIRATVPNSAPISQTVAEIWPFSIFQNGGRPPSCILKSSTF